MITIKNKYHIQEKLTSNDIYIGRGSILGNPYTSFKDKKTLAKFICNSREESIECFKTYLLNEIKNNNTVIRNELNRIYKLAKKQNVNLICFCKPKACHGDIIKSLIDNYL